MSLSEQIDQLTTQLVVDSQISGPPFDALEIATRLGVDVIFDRNQPTRARHKLIGKRSTIFLKPEARLERQQWSIAHELGEIFAGNILNNEGSTHDPGPDRLPIREQIASEIGTRLLLPEPSFSRLSLNSQFDLAIMKSLFSTASYELIARRLVGLQPNLVISMFDQGKLIRRLSINGHVRRDLEDQERLCWQRCHAENAQIRIHGEHILTRCWPVHEPTWKREFLMTEPST